MTNRMSIDRVRFTIFEGVYKSETLEYDRVLGKAFSLSYNQIHRAFLDHGQLIILCRPSQFARFLIYRHEAHIPNSYSALNAKLEPGVNTDNTIEVWRNPHNERM